MFIYYYSFIIIFPQGWSYWPSSPRITREGLFDQKLKVPMPFLSDKKWRVNKPPSTLIFSQIHPIKILR